jgi:hypothetical protein
MEPTLEGGDIAFQETPPSTELSWDWRAACAPTDGSGLPRSIEEYRYGLTSA